MKRGFTLIELLVVISIIALLSSVVLTSLNSARAKGRDAKRVMDLKQIQNALEQYALVNGKYPDIFGGSGSANCSAFYVPAGNISTSWLSPYLSVIPTDPSYNTASPALPYAYQYCQRYNTTTSTYDTSTYNIWAYLEASPGNMSTSLWPVGATRPASYNYVLSNWAP